MIHPAMLVQDVLAPAHDIVMPATPLLGINPVVQWLMGVASVLLPGLFSILLVFLKQKFNSDQANINGIKIANAAQHGAALGRNNGANLSSATEIGVNYIKNSVPDAIAAPPQATDGHLADMIRARLPVAIVKPPSKGPMS